MKKKEEKTKLQMSNVHRWRLAGFLAQPGTVSTYARYLARELHEKVQFTSQEIKTAGIEEQPEGRSVRFTWKAQVPKCIYLDEEERLAVLEILLTKPAEWLQGAGDDLIHTLTKDREELKELLALYQPEKPEAKPVVPKPLALAEAKA